MARWLLMIGWLISLPLQGAEVESLLSLSEPPEGVVFEVVAGAGALSWAIPQIREDAARLRTRFPGLPIAVVSHGREQFDLLSERASGEGAALHQAVQSLVTGEEVTLHVCGTHASWYDIPPEAFPDYVDVAPAGPTQISDYQALGYRLLRVERRPTP